MLARSHPHFALRVGATLAAMRFEDALAAEQKYKDSAADFQGEAHVHIDGLLEENDVEALVSLANAFSLANAAARYPAVTVPAQPAIGQATNVRTAPPVGD